MAVELVCVVLMGIVWGGLCRSRVSWRELALVFE